MEKITVEELHARMKAQGVSAREHVAFKCPICSTVQSIASLTKAGAPADRVENVAGFSCEGRLTNAGAWPSAKDSSAKAQKRRGVRGCDWTLGGFFRVHQLTVETPDGKEHPIFMLATPEEARELERVMLERAPA